MEIKTIHEIKQVVQHTNKWNKKKRMRMLDVQIKGMQLHNIE